MDASGETARRGIGAGHDGPGIGGPFFSCEALGVSREGLSHRGTEDTEKGEINVATSTSITIEDIRKAIDMLQHRSSDRVPSAVIAGKEMAVRLRGECASHELPLIETPLSQRVPTGRYVIDGVPVPKCDVKISGRFCEYGPEDVEWLVYTGEIEIETEEVAYVMYGKSRGFYDRWFAEQLGTVRQTGEVNFAPDRVAGIF